MPLVSLLGLPCPALPEPEVGHSVWHSLTLQSLTSLSEEETFLFFFLVGEINVLVKQKHLFAALECPTVRKYVGSSVKLPAVQ